GPANSTILSPRMLPHMPNDRSNTLAAAEALAILTEANALLADDRFVYISGDHGSGWIDKDAIYPTRNASSGCDGTWRGRSAIGGPITSTVPELARSAGTHPRPLPPQRPTAGTRRPPRSLPQAPPKHP